MLRRGDVLRSIHSKIYISRTSVSYAFTEPYARKRRIRLIGGVNVVTSALCIQKLHRTVFRPVGAAILELNESHVAAVLGHF